MKQINEITFMKAIAIICMVAGHSYTHSSLEVFVGMFHMPLFFICSGYCFKEKYLNDFKKYAIRKFKTIWLPTVKWILALVFLHNMLLNIGWIKEGLENGIMVHSYNLHDYVKYVIMGVTILHSHAPTFAGIWFIKMLLFSLIAGYFIIKYCNGKMLLIIMMTLLFISMILLKFFPGHYPVVNQLHLPFLSTFFLLFGFFIKKMNLLTILTRKRMLLVVCSLLLLLCGFAYWPSSMVSLDYIYCIPFCISAISGTLSIYYLSTLIKYPPRLQNYLLFLGNNTYCILMMHILSFRFVSTILVFTLGLSHDLISEHPTIHYLSNEGYWILYLFLGINIPLLTQYVYNKIIKKWKK